jgi:hypothetical protein
MNLLQEILQVNSISSCKKIADYIGTDEELFAELIQFFLNGDSRTTQCAAGIINECIEQNPFLIKPYYKDFITKLKEPNIHDGIKRNILRAWQFVEIPEEHQGEIYDLCFLYLSDNEPIAVIVFAMTVCLNITKQIPELKYELQLQIEHLLLKHLNGSAGINSRGKKILAELKKK